ncbi:hypothetical protein C7N43_20295 [Sphingobacteriales bacterium UPWRP_1]|nr:hypothetical protein BVG80_02260 [Sphingobacteriales bacterium TSM_CSM]PSJ75166.1 hypothetical protein C7N43_20295 [Sphingobacteriales bacterium UPWRP_1]
MFRNKLQNLPPKPQKHGTAGRNKFIFTRHTNYKQKVLPMPEPVFSPDGRYKVVFSGIEMRMSHWIDSPMIMETATNTLLYTPGNNLWSADTVKWSPDSRYVVMRMREYPGTKKGFTLTFDVVTETCTILPDD